MAVASDPCSPQECEAKENFSAVAVIAEIATGHHLFASKIHVFSRRLFPAHLITLDVLWKFIAVGRAIRKVSLRHCFVTFLIFCIPAPGKPITELLRATPLL